MNKSNSKGENLLQIQNGTVEIGGVKCVILDDRVKDGVWVDEADLESIRQCQINSDNWLDLKDDDEMVHPRLTYRYTCRFKQPELMELVWEMKHVEEWHRCDPVVASHCKDPKHPTRQIFILKDQEQEIDNTDVRGITQNVLNVVNDLANKRQEGERETYTPRDKCELEGAEKDFTLVRKSDDPHVYGSNSDNGYDVAFNMPNLEEFETAHNCRSDSGKIVGLIDAMITCLHFLGKDVDIEHPEIKKALDDFRNHENLQRLLQSTPSPQIQEGMESPAPVKQSVEQAARYYFNSLTAEERKFIQAQPYTRTIKAFLAGHKHANKEVKAGKTAEEVLEAEVSKEGYSTIQEWLIEAGSYNQEQVIIDSMELYRNQTPAPKQLEWVKVSERMPVPNQFVLLSDNGDILLGVFRFLPTSITANGFDLFDSKTDRYTPDEVTHWMPLPTPPNQ